MDTKQQLNDQIKVIKAAVYDALVQKQNAEASIEQLQSLLKQKYAELETANKAALVEEAPSAEASSGESVQ